MIEGSDALASIGMAGVIAMVIGIFKSIAQPRKLPPRAAPLIALLSAVAIVVVGIRTGEFELTILEAVAVVIVQTAEMIGTRELFRSVAPGVLKGYSVGLSGRT